MNLGFHYHIPAIEIGGNILTPGYQGRFIDSLANECESVVCFLHTPNLGEYEILDYKIQSSNVKLVDLGPHDSVPKRLLRSNKLKPIISSWEEKIDVILLRGPSPLLPLFAKTIPQKPRVLLIVGDNTIGIKDLLQPWWRKMLIWLFQNWNKYQQVQATKGALTFVNSRQRFEEYQKITKDLVEIHTTTIEKTDFFYRDDTCSSHPYNLVYAGRLDRAKGIFELVEAVSNLNESGKDIVLNFVGWADKSGTVLAELEAFSEKLGVTERVKFHGYQPLGPHLFQFYKDSDIFVIASYSEGFPRSIWEAMAHGLPVIATKVGSIPAFVEGVAYLIPPRDTVELSKAINLIIHDKRERMRMISDGYNLALENTLEIQTAKMIERIAIWIKYNE